MADLDPQMQTVGQIYGLKINIGDENFGISGDLIPCSFRDLWSSIEDSPDIVQSFSAVYQSVLKLKTFSPGQSPFLNECVPFVERSKQDGLYPNGSLTLVIRLDNYKRDDALEDWRFGDVQGYIEPWLPGSPQQMDAQRVMYPIKADDTKDAYFRLQRDEQGKHSIFVYLANSLRRQKDLSYKAQGELFLAILPEGHSVIGGFKTEVIASIPYQKANWEKDTGAIFEVSIPEYQVERVNSMPLGIISTNRLGANSVLLCERKNGIFCHADIFTYRLNPDETQFVEFYVTKFGRRLPNADVVIGYDNTSMCTTGETDGGPIPGKPASALIINGTCGDDDIGYGFSTVAKTGPDGVAVVSLTGGDTGNPREYIDGQVYGLRYDYGRELPPLSPTATPSNNINVLVHDRYHAPERPTWLSDVYPHFKQFANLYPCMRTIVSLDDFGSVVARRESLIRVFSVPLDDPSYMPIPRDLSKAKREMFLKWLKDVNTDDGSPEFGIPLYMDITSKADLGKALQTVIELEHGTLPPYLTALYSIKRGTNQYIADAILDVCLEEMLHFAIACNIMNAVGFRPGINKIGFVPKFPGPLPGGLRTGLILRLRKCSKEQLASFMEVEAPYQNKLPDKSDVSAVSGNLHSNMYTIAFLYEKIEKSLKILEANGEITFPAHGGDPENLKNQVTGPWPGKLVPIMTLEDALNSIEMIKEQGEGASPSDPSDGTIDPETGLPMLAHYFKFAEIVKGRRIVSGKDGGFSYTGPKIELDTDGIYNMQDDPNLKLLPIGSKARERMEAFCRKYQTLLNGLHDTFNGEPEFLDQTLSSMYQLTLFAKPLMEMPAINPDGTPKKDGTTVGVSFEVPYTD